MGLEESQSGERGCRGEKTGRQPVCLPALPLRQAVSEKLMCGDFMLHGNLVTEGEEPGRET